MKRLFCALSAAALLLALGANAAENYNYALGKSPVGTFKNHALAVDGSLATFSSSGNIAETPQFFTIDLGKSIYAGSVKIYWRGGALSHDYSVRLGMDAKTWVTVFSGLDAADGVPDTATGTVAQVVSTRRYTIPSRYLQVYIPIGSSATAPQVGIAEIQVTEATDLKFSMLEVRPYALSDRRAIIVYKTSIGAVTGQVLYGRDPANLDKIAANLESGVVNSASLTDIDPAYVYFYRVKAWDAFGNMVESGVNNFRPPRANIALGKSVTGTFSNLPPSDPLVSTNGSIIGRIVDGRTNYFNSMATSGSIRGADQQVTIDLGGSYSLDSVVSYWRALAYPEKFIIRASRDSVSWTDLASGVNAGEGAFARSDSGDPMRVTSTLCSGTTARYLQILVPKDSPFFVKHANWDFVQLMEVEVFSK